MPTSEEARDIIEKAAELARARIQSEAAQSRISLQGERIAILETRFAELQRTMETHAANDLAQHADVKLTLESTEKKLDELLTLKDKGMGALWFVSLIFGSGILGIIYAVWNAFR